MVITPAGGETALYFSENLKFSNRQLGPGRTFPNLKMFLLFRSLGFSSTRQSGTKPVRGKIKIPRLACHYPARRPPHSPPLDTRLVSGPVRREANSCQPVGPLSMAAVKCGLKSPARFDNSPFPVKGTSCKPPRGPSRTGASRAIGIRFHGSVEPADSRKETP